MQVMQWSLYVRMCLMLASSVLTTFNFNDELIMQILLSETKSGVNFSKRLTCIGAQIPKMQKESQIISQKKSINFFLTVRM